MHKPSDFKTNSVALAAALMALTGQRPHRIGPGRKELEFTFLAEDVPEGFADLFAAEKMFVEVSEYARCHRWLMSECDEILYSGKEVTYP